jgi:hypothetical protein
MSKPLSYEVGEQGRFQGVIVEKYPASGRYVEVLAYGGSALGECTVFIYTLGPRGGAHVEEGHTTPGKLRKRAERLDRYATIVENYMKEVLAGHGR